MDSWEFSVRIVDGVPVMEHGDGKRPDGVFTISGCTPSSGRESLKVAFTDLEGQLVVSADLVYHH